MRKIRRSKWYRNDGAPWLTEGELQADAIGDLRTEDNKLSVWHVDDLKANLNQVVTALAANCDSISNLDYALIDQQLLTEIHLKIEDTRGKSPHHEANVWHREFVELSASKLMELAKAVGAEAQKDRISSKKIRELLIQSVASGEIKLESLPEKVRERVRPNAEKAS